jgi:hypothetical protein
MNINLVLTKTLVLLFTPLHLYIHTAHTVPLAQHFDIMKVQTTQVAVLTFVCKLATALTTYSV